MAQLSCTFSLDNNFGPSVNSCRRAFDFTLLFEQSILSILPSSLFIVLAVCQAIYTRKSPQVVNRGVFLGVKLVGVTALFALQLALLILYSANREYTTKASIAATALSLVSALILAPLSFTEHVKSLQPSELISAYLAVTVLLDAVQVRSLWMADVESSIAGVFTGTFATKAVLLLVESYHKTRWFKQASDQKSSPADRAGIFSRGLLLWIDSLIWKGFRHELKLDDLFPLPGGFMSESLESRPLENWEHAPKTGKYSLLVTIARTLKFQLIAPIIPRLGLIALTVCQPLLLIQVLAYVDAPDTPSEQNKGYGLLGAYALVYIGVAVTTAWYWHETYRFITCVRGSLVTVIYRRTLELDIAAVDKSAAVTIMSADVERIVFGLRMMHEIWANTVQVAFAAWLLEIQVGVAVIPSLVVAAVCAVLTMKIGGAAGGAQGVWMEAIEKRIGITSSTLSSIKGVKISGLSEKLMDLVQSLRKKELKSAAKYRWWEVAALMMGFTPVLVSPVLTFAIFIAADKANHRVLDASRMFSSLSFLTLISQPLSMLFQSAPELASMVSCFERIQKFILTEDRVDSRRIGASDGSIATSNESPMKEKLQVDITPLSSDNAITLNNAKFSWPGRETPVLQQISTSIAQGKLTMVVGPVGCGKTTLLKALLGEIAPSEGSVLTAKNNFAYCDQSPWIFEGTLKENIVGFSEFDQAWYDTVLHACALDEDFARFPAGHETTLGGQGLNMSGGQKQRVSLARLLFARREVNIIDDILSGLDATTESKVLHRLLGPNGILSRAGSTIVLATHAIHHASYADHIICIGSNGEIVEQGTFADLKQANGYLQSLNLSESRDTLVDETEKIDRGSSSSEDEPLDEKDVASSDVSIPDKQSKNRRNTYVFYMKATGKFSSFAYVFIAVIYAFLYVFPYVWAEWWTNANEKNPGHDEATYMGIYALFQACCFISLAVLAWHSVINVVTSAGNSLHWTVLKTVLSAPMSFFEKTATGSIVNRFSQDMNLIDTELPVALLGIFCSGLIILGQLLLIMNASYWIAITYPFIFLVMFVLQKVYLRTSRQLRQMDLEFKSPIYSQFLESLDGLATIRAFSWSRSLIKQNHDRLDSSQRPFYLLFVIQRWLSLVMDCIVAGLIILLIGLIIGLKSKISAGFAGVALSNFISLSGLLTDIIMVWTEFETSMTSVKRVKEFEEDTPLELLPSESITPPESWPDKGGIKIQNITATYKHGTVTALNNISMDIQPGEKIGVCGRTGSGKSSLMMTLFKMIDLSGPGSILIDDIDVASVPSGVVRSALNAVPQEPFFLAGSVRLNIDPYGSSTDEQVLEALSKVHLRSVIKEKGGLDADLEKDSLSHGQRQLFCLARAILRQSKIVVLDEITSSIDIETDRLIQDVVKEQFKSCTVITIAHRLNTIMDSDRIAFLDYGELIEFDTPSNLLDRESRFKTFYGAYLYSR